MTGPFLPPLLAVEGLTTIFPTRAGPARVVDDVSFHVNEGECLGVVGESGSGKSITFLSILGLVRPPGRVSAKRMIFAGKDLLALGEGERRAIRGRDIAITMQDALTALNPALTVATQITEVMLAHGRARSQEEARAAAIEMMRLVGIPAAANRLDDYPHQFSGGMRQRIMIATALACRPRLLIADEPTTALDVTIQAQVLELIAELRRELRMSVVLITHDLGVVVEQADRIMVMYAGQIVEEGACRAVIEDAAHPYTAGLLASMPSLDTLDRPIHPIRGQAPLPGPMPAQCRFFDRCEQASEACRIEVPLRPFTDGRTARCIRLKEGSHG
ncbi:MAG: ABC transporter ATP-binding protein [Beijerinckiaceae bacterium]|jgi:oligopeptide/dipeptide ABC transporter ATP-binding protein|nr:ABC transporter ATP-binding protein [Beijerinckiaceae bacterium]